MKIKIISFLLLISSFSLLISAYFDKTKSYNFDEKGISEEVLGNYLDRAVTMAFFLVP